MGWFLFFFSAVPWANPRWFWSVTGRDLCRSSWTARPAALWIVVKFSAEPWCDPLWTSTYRWKWCIGDIGSLLSDLKKRWYTCGIKQIWYGIRKIWSLKWQRSRCPFETFGLRRQIGSRVASRFGTLRNWDQTKLAWGTKKELGISNGFVWE